MKSLWSVDNRVRITLFFLAVLLWLFVVSNRDYEAHFSIPLQIKGLEAGYLFVQDPPKTVNIACKGRGRDLLVWRYFLDTHLELNVSGFSAKREFRLVPEMVTVPAGFPIRDLTIASPETLRLHIDKLMEKRVPVRVDCDIEPAPGFVLSDSVFCEPDSIVIHGPQILVRQVDEVSTQYRHFYHATESIEARLPLKNTFSPKIVLETYQVLIKAKIESVEQTSLDSIPVEVRNVPNGKRSILFPAYVSLILEGSRSSLEALDTIPVQLFLDYKTDWNAESTLYRPTFEGPHFVKVIAMNPPEVSWKVQKATAARKKH